MNFKNAALIEISFLRLTFIIVSLIGLNIVFGIIVDTFAELRNERVIDITLICWPLIIYILYYVDITL